MDNFHKFIEKTRYLGQCEECPSIYPNERTTALSPSALHGWRKRHQHKTGHSVKTSVTYVRRYPKE